MLTPTSKPTDDQVAQAEEERADHAIRTALCEMASEYAKVSSYRDFRRWCRDVNRKADEIFKRLQ